jgi:hypothetical protein
MSRQFSNLRMEHSGNETGNALDCHCKLRQSEIGHSSAKGDRNCLTPLPTNTVRRVKF